MISVTVHFNRDKEIIGYTMSGHALSGEPGHDLVCASASTLGLAALNTLTDVCGLEDKTDYEYGDGYLAVHLDSSTCTDQEKEKAEIVFRGYMINIESLVRQYPENISLLQEVLE